MPDLHWTIPVTRWSSWAAHACAVPDLGFIEPLVRRRLSALSKMALKVAHDCADPRPTRLLFASRHGELRRTTEILQAICAGEEVSPTAFSLSVLNAMTGIFGMARADRSSAGALSAGPATLGYGLLEAWAQYEAEPDTPVLLVYADEPADPLYQAGDDEIGPGALALLIDAGAATGTLSCAISENAAGTDRPAGSFPSQQQALQHCLDHAASAAWSDGLNHWQWSWHGRAA